MRMTEIDIGAVSQPSVRRGDQERMNSPLERHEVRLRGLARCARVLVVVVAAIVTMTASVAAQVSPEEAQNTADAAIGRLRSPFCPGLMLEVCPSPPAEALRDSIRGMAAEGQGVEQIVEGVLARHGEEWRAVPKRSGVGLLAWLVLAARAHGRRPVRVDARAGHARAGAGVRHRAGAGDDGRRSAPGWTPPCASSSGWRTRRDAARLFAAAGVLAAAFVIRPLAARRDALLVDVASGAVLDAEARRRVALTSLKELDYDYLGGKLDDADYRAQKERLSLEALAAMRAAEAVGYGAGRRGRGRRGGGAGPARVRVPEPAAEPLLRGVRGAAALSAAPGGACRRRPPSRRVAWRSGTARCRRCGGSTWRWRGASSSPSSGPTARARARCCACSAAPCVPRAAPSASAGMEVGGEDDGWRRRIGLLSHQTFLYPGLTRGGEPGLLRPPVRAAGPRGAGGGRAARRWG